METKYGVAAMSGANFTMKPEWIRGDYKSASDLARNMTNPAWKVYVVRIVPVAVFTAKVVVEFVAQPAGTVIEYPNPGPDCPL